MVAISAQEYETRIKALEKLNATLAAEIDRMRPVIEAMQRLQIFDNDVSRDQIADALADYEGRNNGRKRNLCT